MFATNYKSIKDVKFKLKFESKNYQTRIIKLKLNLKIEIQIKSNINNIAQN